jgi:hypothetical protein
MKTIMGLRPPHLRIPLASRYFLLKPPGFPYCCLRLSSALDSCNLLTAGLKTDSSPWERLLSLAIKHWVTRSWEPPGHSCILRRLGNRAYQQKGVSCQHVGPIHASHLLGAWGGGKVGGGGMDFLTWSSYRKGLKNTVRTGILFFK